MVKQCLLLITLMVIVHSLNSGTVLIQNEGGGQIQTKEILFSQPFQQIPQVAIALLNGHGDIFAEIHDVTQEGFSLQMMASDEIEAKFAYLIIENDKNYQIECFNRIDVGNEIQIPVIIQKPTFIGVLATNTHANNFNIDLFDDNLIVDNDGKLNMCIIITNEEQPIELIGYQNYQKQEAAEFHSFIKQNAMSLVQAQQSLEITQLDQHKSFEIWHHQSIEIVQDSTNEVYPTNKSFEVVNEEEKPNQTQFKQQESIEIFKLDDKDQQINSDQKLIAQDIHLDIIDNNLDSNNNQLEDIKLEDPSNELTQQQTAVAVSGQMEDITLDLESTQENQQSEKNTEDVKLITEDLINNQDSQEIKLTNDEVQIIEPKNESVVSSDEQQGQNNKKVDQVQTEQIDQQNQDKDVSNLSSETVTNNNDQVLQQEDITFDNLDNDIVNQQEESKQEIQIEDIKLDDTNVSSINSDDIPHQQDAKDIQNDSLSIQSEAKSIEDTTSTEDVVVHVDEVKIENVKISEANLDDISTEQQVQEDNTEQIQEDKENNIEQQDNKEQIQEEVEENNLNHEIQDQSEDVSVDPDAFSEPQQKVTQINDDLLKQESDIDEMIKYAQELKEEAKQLKNKNRNDQQQEKLDIMEKATVLENEVGQLQNESEEPKVVEDQISLDINSGYDDQQDKQIEQPKEEQQPPIIYLNDGGVNSEQQLITQEIKEDDKLMITDNQLQEVVDQELKSQEQQVESTSQIGEEDIQIIDASIKLDDDHQELEVYQSGQIEVIPDQVQPQVEEVQSIEQPQEQVEVEAQEEQVQEQETAKEEGEIEIGLTTDEGEAFISQSKQSDLLKENQRLQDKQNNVIRDYKLDSVQNNSLDSVVDGDEQSSDILDVPDNNEQVIELKDEDYEQSQIEPEPEQEIKQLGDYLEVVEPNIENVNFIYGDEQQQEQQTIQIEDIKLNDDNADEETNYKIVEAKDNDLIDTTLESVDDTQKYQLLSTDVSVVAEETSVNNVENQSEDEINISLDEFQKELEVLANTIGNIKQENVETTNSNDYIVVNDNSQIYEATYDEQSNELPQEDEPQIQEDQQQYYQGLEDDQNTSVGIQQPENQDQQQEVEQVFDVPEINQDQLSENQFSVNEQSTEDTTQQVETYDDVEPQDQYLTIDNLVKDSSAIEESYEQAPQYYDESDNKPSEQQTQSVLENSLESDYDISEQQQQQQKLQEQVQSDNGQQQQQEQDFVVMKADQFKPQVQDESEQQQQLSDIQQVEDIYSETPKDENEIDIIIDVGNQQNDQPQLSEQDYDYQDNFEIQQPTKNEVEKQSQQQQQQSQQLQQDSISNRKHKQKIQHSITISHNPQESNNKQTDRSIEIQHEDKSLKIEHSINQEELKKDLKEQLKQELKEELKQEIKQEIQESHNRRKSASLVIEENVAKDPERPAQKAINNFNNLLKDVVDETLKEEDRKHYQKLPIVDVKKESFNKEEPKIEQGIEDLKKSLGLKGGVEVVDNDGKKQVINVDDLKKESEKLLTRPERDNKNDNPQYEEYLKKVTEKSQTNNNDQFKNYEEQHNIRKQEILENIKRELEIKKGHFTVPNDSPQELSPYEFERVYLDWEKNKQDIIPSMLQHSIEQPITQEKHSNSEVVQQKSSERISRKEEVEKEVQELLYGSQNNKKQQSKQASKEFKVEDLKYIKDDPLLDSTYSGFVQVKANLRMRQQ